MIILFAMSLKISKFHRRKGDENQPNGTRIRIEQLRGRTFRRVLGMGRRFMAEKNHEIARYS